MKLEAVEQNVVTKSGIPFEIEIKHNAKLKAANISYTDEEKAAIVLRAKEMGYIEETLIGWEGEGVLVWGHGLHEIAKEHNLKFEIKYKSFATMQDALAEIAEKKLLIPTLTLFSKIEAARPFGNYWQEKYDDRSHPVCVEALQRFGALCELGIVAVKAGTSRTTVNKVNRILESKKESLIEQCRNGEISISAAYEMIKVPESDETNTDNSQDEGKEGSVLAAEQARKDKRRMKEASILAQYSVKGFSNGEKLTKTGRKFFVARWNDEHPDNCLSEKEVEKAVRDFGKE